MKLKIRKKRVKYAILGVLLLVAIAGIYFLGRGVFFDITAAQCGNVVFTGDSIAVSGLENCNVGTYNGWWGGETLRIITPVNSLNGVDVTKFKVTNNDSRVYIGAETGGCGIGKSYMVEAQNDDGRMVLWLYFAPISSLGDWGSGTASNEHWQVTCSQTYLSQTNPAMNLRGYVVFRATCDNQTAKPCNQAVWNDYPDCSWDTSGCNACTGEYAPVCGVNNQTYTNICLANQAGVSVGCNNECPCHEGSILDYLAPIMVVAAVISVLAVGLLYAFKWRKRK